MKDSRVCEEPATSGSPNHYRGGVSQITQRDNCTQMSREEDARPSFYTPCCPNLTISTQLRRCKLSAPLFAFNLKTLKLRGVLLTLALSLLMRTAASMEATDWVHFISGEYDDMIGQVLQVKPAESWQ